MCKRESLFSAGVLINHENLTTRITLLPPSRVFWPPSFPFFREQVRLAFLICSLLKSVLDGRAATMALIPAKNHTGITVIVIASIASFLAVVAIGLRIWARKLKKANLDASDWTCMAGLVCIHIELADLILTNYSSLLWFSSVPQSTVRRALKGKISDLV